MQRRRGVRGPQAMGPGAGLVIGLAVLVSILTGCDGGGSTGSTPPGPTPPAIPTALVRGEAVFTRYCQVCHPGGNQGVGARLIGNPLSDDQMKAVVRHGQKNMPAFSPETISDADLPSLIDYIRSLK